MDSAKKIIIEAIAIILGESAFCGIFHPDIFKNGINRIDLRIFMHWSTLIAIIIPVATYVLFRIFFSKKKTQKDGPTNDSGITIFPKNQILKDRIINDLHVIGAWCIGWGYKFSKLPPDRNLESKNKDVELTMLYSLRDGANVTYTHAFASLNRGIGSGQNGLYLYDKDDEKGEDIPLIPYFREHWKILLKPDDFKEQGYVSNPFRKIAWENEIAFESDLWKCMDLVNALL
jgi:hypothetical protein